MGLHLPETPRGRLSTGRYQSFIVRIWSRGTTGDVLHGGVVHVGTRRSAHLRDLRGLLNFMLRALKAPPDREPPVPWRPPDE